MMLELSNGTVIDLTTIQRLDQWFDIGYRPGDKGSSAYYSSLHPHPIEIFLTKDDHEKLRSALLRRGVCSE